MKKINICSRIKRAIYIRLMCKFNRTPRWFRTWFSKKLYNPKIDKTVSIAGLPIYLQEVSIGKYTYLNGNAYLENVDIGNYCSIGRDLNIMTGSHDLNAFSTFPFWARNIITPFFGYDPIDVDVGYPCTIKKTYIGNDVWIGSYVKIIGGVKIGTGAVIGAGSVVTRDVPPYAIVVGCPAKIIRYRFDKDRINQLLESEWWNYSKEELINNWDKLV